jgi:GH24 family phage-related lysozyme (muramidase)
MPRFFTWLRQHKRGEEEASFAVDVAWLAYRLVGAGVLGASVASAAILSTSTSTSAPSTHISPKAVAFIERHEGVRHFPYQDPSGIAACTVGAGHVLAWKFCTSSQLRTFYSSAQISAFLKSDVAHAEGCVRALGSMPQPEFDALVDLTFNAGCGSLGYHSRPYYRTVGSLWAEPALLAAEVRSTATTAGGRVLGGLVTRRGDEATLILTGFYGSGIGYYQPPNPRKRGPTSRLGRCSGIEWPDRPAVVYRLARCR